MVPEEILDDQNQDQEQEQEQESNNSESEDITKVYSAKEWQSGQLISSGNLNDIEIELEKLSRAYLAKLGEMIGATSTSDGTAGYVPKPLEGDQNKFLNGAGAWQEIIIPNNAVTQNTSTLINKQYPILLGHYDITDEMAQTNYTDSVNKTPDSITINPSTGEIKATSFSGDGSQLNNINLGKIIQGVTDTTFPSSFIPLATSNNIGGVKIESNTDPDNTIIIDSNGVIKVANPLPKVTDNDAGKFLRVDEDGNWAVIEILNAADAGVY